MIAVRVAQVIDANRSKSNEVVASHACRCQVPVDNGRVKELIDEGVGSCRLKFAKSRVNRKCFGAIGKAARGAVMRWASAHWAGRLTGRF